MENGYISYCKEDISNAIKKALSHVVERMRAMHRCAKLVVDRS